MSIVLPVRQTFGVNGSASALWVPTPEFPSELLEMTENVPYCCQRLPDSEGGLAEKKACQAFSYLKMSGIIIDFRHAFRNDELDSMSIDFLAHLTCGCEFKLQVKSSEIHAERHRERIRNGRISKDIAVIAIRHKLNIKEVISKIHSLLNAHFSFCGF